VITGATGIIGSWISRAFAEEGASLWLLGLHKETIKEIGCPFASLWGNSHRESRFIQ